MLTITMMSDVFCLLDTPQQTRSSIYFTSSDIIDLSDIQVLDHYPISLGSFVRGRQVNTVLKDGDIDISFELEQVDIPTDPYSKAIFDDISYGSVIKARSETYVYKLMVSETCFDLLRNPTSSVEAYLPIPNDLVTDREIQTGHVSAYHGEHDNDGYMRLVSADSVDLVYAQHVTLQFSDYPIQFPIDVVYVPEQMYWYDNHVSLYRCGDWHESEFMEGRSPEDISKYIEAGSSLGGYINVGSSFAELYTHDLPIVGDDVMLIAPTDPELVISSIELDNGEVEVTSSWFQEYVALPYIYPKIGDTVVLSPDTSSTVLDDQEPISFDVMCVPMQPNHIRYSAHNEDIAAAVTIWTSPQFDWDDEVLFSSSKLIGADIFHPYSFNPARKVANIGDIQAIDRYVTISQYVNPHNYLSAMFDKYLNTIPADLIESDYSDTYKYNETLVDLVALSSEFSNIADSLWVTTTARDPFSASADSSSTYENIHVSSTWHDAYTGEPISYEASSITSDYTSAARRSDGSIDDTFSRTINTPLDDCLLLHDSSRICVGVGSESILYGYGTVPVATVPAFNTFRIAQYAPAYSSKYINRAGDKSYNADTHNHSSAELRSTVDGENRIRMQRNGFTENYRCDGEIGSIRCVACGDQDHLDDYGTRPDTEIVYDRGYVQAQLLPANNSSDVLIHPALYEGKPHVYYPSGLSAYKYTYSSGLLGLRQCPEGSVAMHSRGSTWDDGTIRIAISSSYINDEEHPESNVNDFTSSDLGGVAHSSSWSSNLGSDYYRTSLVYYVPVDTDVEIFSGLFPTTSSAVNSVCARSESYTDARMGGVVGLPHFHVSGAQAQGGSSCSSLSISNHSHYRSSNTGSTIHDWYATGDRIDNTSMYSSTVQSSGYAITANADATLAVNEYVSMLSSIAITYSTVSSSYVDHSGQTQIYSYRSPISSLILSCYSRIDITGDAKGGYATGGPAIYYDEYVDHSYFLAQSSWWDNQRALTSQSSFVSTVSSSIVKTTACYAAVPNFGYSAWLNIYAVESDGSWTGYVSVGGGEFSDRVDPEDQQLLTQSRLCVYSNGGGYIYDYYNDRAEGSIYWSASSSYSFDSAYCVLNGSSVSASTVDFKPVRYLYTSSSLSVSEIPLGNFYGIDRETLERYVSTAVQIFKTRAIGGYTAIDAAAGAAFTADVTNAVTVPSAGAAMIPAIGSIPQLSIKDFDAAGYDGKYTRQYVDTYWSTCPDHYSVSCSYHGGEDAIPSLYHTVDVSYVFSGLS